VVGEEPVQFVHDLLGPVENVDGRRGGTKVQRCRQDTLEGLAHAVDHGRLPLFLEARQGVQENEESQKQDLQAQQGDDVAVALPVAGLLCDASHDPITQRERRYRPG